MGDVAQKEKDEVILRCSKCGESTVVDVKTVFEMAAEFEKNFGQRFSVDSVDSLCEDCARMVFN
jgi:hypothetical protein